MYVVKNPHTSSLKYILFFPGVKTFQLENLEKGVILTWLLGLNSDFLPTRSVIWFMYRNKLRELSRCTVHFGEVFFFKLRHLKIKWKETWQTWKLRGNKALQGHHEHKTQTPTNVVQFTVQVYGQVFGGLTHLWSLLMEQWIAGARGARLLTWVHSRND